MKDTAIRWCDATWNPMTGCSHVSEGCDHCYAEILATGRFSRAFPAGFAPTFKPAKLREPSKWKDPVRVFVNSMSDVHHPDFDPGDIDAVYDVMSAYDRHDFLVLTKRPQRMADHLLSWIERRGLVELPRNIWVGTSIESDRWAFRSDHLRRIPAAVRFVSAEPLLGPLPSLDLTGIDWLIVGGESGSGSWRFRPMDHDWARDLRDRATAAGVAFFFKQSAGVRTETGIELDGVRVEEWPRPHPATRLGVAR